MVSRNTVDAGNLVSHWFLRLWRPFAGGLDGRRAAASNGGRQQRRVRPSPHASSAGSASSPSEAPAAEVYRPSASWAEANALGIM